MKHTPGPWRVGDAGCVVFGPKTDAPIPKRIAVLTSAAIPSEETRANAALIAEAPAMLEALRRVMDFEQRIRACKADGGNVLADEINDIIHRLENLK